MSAAKAYGAMGSLNVKECHIGAIDVMEVGQTVVWAGGWPDMDWDLTWDLRIRLNDAIALRTGSTPLIRADQEAKEMLLPEVYTVKYPPTLNVEWDDFGTPPMDVDWWRALIKSLEGMKPGTNVALYCQGGHGRTGTALSILAALTGKVKPSEDPVEWVRKNYCSEAVESYTQLEYIAHITKCKVRALPSFKYRATGAGGVMMPEWKENDQGKWEVEFKQPDNVQKITPATTVFGTNPAAAMVKAMTQRKGKK